MTRPDFLQRTRALLEDAGLKRLTRPLVAISGLGGVGGAAFMTLVRSGVRRFRLAENGIFDPPDMNRQWGALGTTLDRPKLDVYVEWATSINPDIELACYPEGITLTNIEPFLEGADIYIGAIDVDKGKALKEASNRICREAQIPLFTCGAVGFGALMINYAPAGMTPDEFWGHAVTRSKKSGLLPSVMTGFFPEKLMANLEASIASGRLATCSVGAGQAGILLASEVIAYVLRDSAYLNRDILFAPRYTALDLLKMELKTFDITSAGES